MKIRDEELLGKLEKKMLRDEKSKATREKYHRDVQKFLDFAGDAEITKEVVIEFKRELSSEYEVSSANSMIAAVNYFLKSIGKEDCCVKSFKEQKEHFRSSQKELSREEFALLLKAAKNKNPRLYMIMQTMGSTGIRISELPFITAEALKDGRANWDWDTNDTTVEIRQEEKTDADGNKYIEDVSYIDYALKVTNKIKRANLVVYKTDMQGNALAGATFNLYRDGAFTETTDAAGKTTYTLKDNAVVRNENLVSTLTQGEDPKALVINTDIAYGTYYLQEASAPNDKSGKKGGTIVNTFAYDEEAGGWYHVDNAPK